jgi:glycosyltransferase involved in cell wall biosynthesis
MKVMYVCTTGGAGRRQLGGAERILTELIPAMAARGVEVLACTTDDAVAAALRTSGVDWVGMGARSRIDPAYVRQIGAMVDSYAPDVVCSHLLSAAMHTRAALGVTRRRTRLVVTMHNSLWQYRDAATSLAGKGRIQSNIAIDAVLRRLRPHASVAVSRYEAAELTRRGRVKNVHVIPNSLPSGWTGAETGATGRSVAPLARVGFLGRHEFEKGIDYVAPVAALMPDVRFVVAGEGSATPAAAANLELVGRVDAAEFLRGVDVLLVPSRVESFGLSAIEAMSLGVPVVHTGAGGLAEVTRAGAGVLAFETAPDPASMAAAIRTALAPGPAGQRAKVADQYLTEYAFATLVDRWHDLYRTLTG